MKSKTIEFFKEISIIPRESGNEEKISDYIVSFAKKRGLDYIKDKYNNVIIKKYINDETPIILQAHLDMVCEKEIDKNFNFKKDPIKLIFEDNYITAEGTALGADNGIGVSQILNILDSNINKNIEAIFTTNEETSMSGAENIDLSTLKGKTMINLDGFDADTILLESASFTDIDIKTDYKLVETPKKKLYKINLFGLKGGHSGFDIDKKRGNAITLLGELLSLINDVKISEFKGGTKINVIPSNAEAIIESNENINDIVKDFTTNNKNSNIKIKVEKVNNTKKLLSKKETDKLLNSILSLNHGVINKNNRNEVTTSQNIALINLTKNIIQIGLRSSIEKEKNIAINKLTSYCDNYNYKLKIIGYQPGFCTDENSKLVKAMKESYKRINNTYPELKSLHVAVEVGLIKEKIKDLNVIIISPKIIDAHTTNERVEISSIKKCDDWLINFIKEYK